MSSVKNYLPLVPKPKKLKKSIESFLGKALVPRVRITKLAICFVLLCHFVSDWFGTNDEEPCKFFISFRIPLMAKPNE